MWVQANGSGDRKVVLFDYTTSRAQDVPLRLLESYCDYVMTDDSAKKLQPKGKTGHADIALTMIDKLYGIERELKDVSDEQRFIGGQEKS